VRLFDRFPQQQPFELFEELVCFSAAQSGLIELYRKRQPTISEHQQTITGYLRLRPFDDAAAVQLEQILFEESCRLEQSFALMGRAREFLKEQCVLEPAEFRIARIVGEQRVRAREHIFRRVGALVPSGLAGTLEDLLLVKPDENSSGLQAIKANPSKPSVDAMLTLLDKLKLIEARLRACLGSDSRIRSSASPKRRPRKIYVLLSV